MAIRNLTNLTNTPLVLTDLNGLTIPPNGTVDGNAFGPQALANSNSVMSAILASEISVSDGTNTYTDGQAVDLIRGLPLNMSQWGTEIVTSSDMPTGTNVYWTGAADGNVPGNGTPFTFNVASGDTSIINATFLTNVWLKQGEIYYEPANDIGSYISVQIVVPAGMPFSCTSGKW